MKTASIQKFLTLFCLFALFVFPAFSVFAQETIQTEQRTFAEFRNEVISLHGPSDTQPIKFNLPAHWHLTGDVVIQLDTTTFLPDSLAGFQGTAGTIKLTVNGKTVSELPIIHSGDSSGEMTIQFADVPADEPVELQLLLESHLPPQPGQEDIFVHIHPSSRFQFMYESVLPSTDLVRFPRQFIQESLEPDRALLVIPDQPTALELQSALTVAAGLGRLSKNQLTLELVSVGQVTPEMQAGNHLILVGKPEPFLALQGLIFPSPIVVRSDPEWTVQFLLPDRYEFERTVPDDGLVQLVNSPWSGGHFVLLVSGETDAGVVKAAQAVSSGKLRKNVFPNLAIVKETRISSPASQPDLQPDSTTDDIARSLTLSDFSAPFISDSTLSSTAFILPRDDLPAWRVAMRLAGQLGATADGTAVSLTALYGDELPEGALSRYNILAVGRASTLPFIAELQDLMPVLFEKGKDIPADTGLDIVYRISKDYDSAGYLEILPSNDGYVILTVLGTNPQGIEWAADALTEPSMRDQLSGNFALINETQLYARDTLSSLGLQELITPTPEQSGHMAVSETPSSPQAEKLHWFWQAGFVLLLLSALVLAVYLQKKFK